MNWKKILVGGGLTALAPFTGGSSLAFLPAALAGTGIATGIGGAFDGGGAKKPKDADPDIAPFLKQLEGSANTASATGKELSGMSRETLQPILDYFQSLVGGDENALLAATRPERSRVIDQYDTARKTISEFGPRGGGTNSAVADSFFGQADELSNITALARRDAVGQSAQIGTALQGLGLTAEQMASGDLTSIINAILTSKGLKMQESGQNKQLAAGLSEGLGTLLGLYLTRGAGSGAGATS